MPFCSVRFESDCSSSDCPALKKKHRRRKCKKRALKPFYFLSRPSNKKSDKTESPSVDTFCEGLPLAPFNSTSFIIDEHGKEDASQSQCAVTENYLKEEFSTIYDEMNIERLNSMTKDKLIQEFLYIERKYNITKMALEKSVCIKCGTKCDFLERCKALNNCKANSESVELLKGVKTR